MATGITTSDGKDLDERFVRTVDGVGPNSSGNVAVKQAVTSVQGKTGDVKLMLYFNPDNVVVEKTPSNGAETTYTSTVRGMATLYVHAEQGRSNNSYSSGEDSWYECDPSGNTRMWVKLNNTYLYPDTTKKVDQSYRVTLNLNVGDVITAYTHRSTGIECGSSSHGFLLEVVPTLIIAE